ncbi:hypothetical protein HRR80_004550 [Exophiala dermatitidis]|uniref:Zn(2)-C6 fungal-type domain-containing protein n=1 Tax=Exophiala dermatitidis TaxID=5970 RepID=A0AAN6ETX6_EXODE|nr:hypothetical protein HRR76_005830 [Exophiala dermatitidis]KAJ4553381.1 hypothetical protein HRR79_009576 [Exophiala dermatitidis]KAJ4585914.1 hypothetical protein HRR82_002963 [Exophiala dermatitidis]KAJ4627033.1 hypothetical protein HRR86_004350 [Exophiala dermatitidis]KAJ4696068.1 hypothetical protein HRR87_003524 [Exophiala dermatitidis]
MATVPSLKRRRVAHACDSCRSLKAKCDGNQPTCGRCAGYGYSCRWSEGSIRKCASDGNGANLNWLSLETEGQKLRDAIAVYDNLLKDLRKNLSQDDCKTVDLRLASIQLPDYFTKHLGNDAASVEPSPGQAVANDRHPATFGRYLGEASDIRFFHAMQSACSQQTQSGQQEDDSEARVDSYEQEGAHQQLLDQNQGSLPPKGSADSFVDIYFSTIHIAYPFISEPDFRRTYESFWQSDSLEGFRGPWLSLLLTIFAIGSCYVRIAEAESEASNPQMSYQHHRHFDRAVAIAQNYSSKHTVDHICALLAQCFYLLATCQTDRCWTTLGLAVRIAQSIGLHVEEDHRAGGENALAPPEMCRRVWYSIYVLDRLLALQLGRPPAISEEDFDVKLPSRQSDVDLSNQRGQHDVQGTDWVGDYFIAMIKFSEIIGRVFGSLYGPRRAGDAALILSHIDRLDVDLSQWRFNLPRHLRFDLSHTFEKSIIYKRQRNMLAVKFYNLQALIHRPLLSPAKIFGSCPDPMAFYRAECGRISMSKRKCVVAAQHTAKLLHNLDDKKSLVYGFPWWQMISCLICASSILLVASICVDLDLDKEAFKDIDWAAVDEDAEVCLKVCQALSSNSNAARLASDMMKRLKKTRTLSQGKSKHPSHSKQLCSRSLPWPFSRGSEPSISLNSILWLPSRLLLVLLQNLALTHLPLLILGRTMNCLGVGATPAAENGADTITDILPSSDLFHATMPSQFDSVDPSQESFNLMFQTMPYEVSEPVMWSAQFVNAVYNPFLHHSAT